MINKEYLTLLGVEANVDQTRVGGENRAYRILENVNILILQRMCMEIIFSSSVLALAPGDPMGSLNVFRPPGPMGPRGVQGPHLRPDMPMHFQGPGGPRQGPPIGPLFPGPEGPMMGPRMRGPMPLRMQGGPGVGRGMPTGPRPLLPEMVSFVCIQFLHRFFLYCKAFCISIVTDERKLST